MTKVKDVTRTRIDVAESVGDVPLRKQETRCS